MGVGKRVEGWEEGLRLKRVGNISSSIIWEDLHRLPLGILILKFFQGGLGGTYRRSLQTGYIGYYSISPKISAIN